MDAEEKKINKLIDFTEDPTLAIFDELQEINDSLDDIVPSFKGVDFSKIDQLQGEPGVTPVKGEDYFTDDEIQQFKKETTPVKGVDYFDGKDGRSPMHVGKNQPSNPQKGDLWYKD